MINPHASLDGQPEPYVAGSSRPPAPVAEGGPATSLRAAPPLAAAAPARNGLAVASLVLSGVGMLMLSCWGVGGVAGVVGAVLGHVARRQIARQDELGDAMAVAGIVLGWVVATIGILVCAAIGIFFLFQTKLFE